MTDGQKSVTCVEFRRLCGADPMNEGAGFLEHQQECPRCAAHYDEMLVFEDMLSRAMHIDVPKPGYTETPEAVPEANPVEAPAAASWRYGWISMAATLVLAVSGATLYLSETAGTATAKELIAHIEHEPAAFVRTGIQADAATVETVMGKSGARMDESVGIVTYARSCYFRGHLVPHLVIQGESGPVTIMILPDEMVDKPERFQENGYRGTILPAAKGSIAIIGGTDESMPAIEQKVVEAVEWST